MRICVYFLMRRGPWRSFSINYLLLTSSYLINAHAYLLNAHMNVIIYTLTFRLNTERKAKEEGRQSTTGSFGSVAPV